MSPEVSKAQAIQLLIERFGIDKKETIAIGDNYNDKGMIEFAGLGIAMGNAPEEIKLIADYVTDTNNNDGVAKALHHYFFR
jgi:hydroxymethylpyrimidine pyrophosphatase-like HAD family hydrolase